MGRGLGPSDDGGTSQSCCPAGRPRALTPAPFAGPQASSHHHVTQAGRLPLQDKLGCSVERCCVHIHSAPAQLPGLTGSTSSLRPQESHTSNVDTWSSPGAGPGGLPHGGGRWEGWELGMQRKGRRDRETPKIEPHRKIRPQDTVPREELPFLEHVAYVGFSSSCFMCLASLRLAFAIPLSS